MIRNLIAIAIITVFAACTARVKPPKVEVDVPHVEIGSGGSNSGKFCPPGQAKKGRC